MARPKTKKMRTSKAPIAKKVKMGGVTLVSEALVKDGVSNLIPKSHVKRGDTVMLITGSEQAGRGKTGKVLSVLTKFGKVVVEGINMISRNTKARTAMSKSGIIQKEGPIFASRVMLYCSSCKKPTRIKHKMIDSGKKKVRVCLHCKESLDS